MVPSNASWITVSTANVLIILPQHLNIAGQLSLKTKNAKVILKGGWSGELLDIGTSNSEIMIEGKVDAVSSVRLKTTNGAIKVLGTCSISNGPMDAATSNGQIIVKKMLTQSSVSLVTSNAKVIADAVYAKNLDIKTSNGGIEVKHSSSDGKISLVTSNAKVSAFVASATNVQVQARTSHGEIRLDMVRVP
ncbi:hypothetical protein BX666DRAFT_1876965 [Dichotomocladium elegans]|nr:hypothetical protein BX666DRAFT_1876965 [Dichotomocladium elegans]